VGNLGRKGEGGKIRDRGKKVSAREISQMDKSVWEEAVGKDAYKKIVGSHNRCEERVYATKREGIPFVERRKGGS